MRSLFGLMQISVISISLSSKSENDSAAPLGTDSCSVWVSVLLHLSVTPQESHRSILCSACTRSQIL